MMRVFSAGRQAGRIVPCCKIQRGARFKRTQTQAARVENGQQLKECGWINSHPAAEYLPEVGQKLGRKSDGKGKACLPWMLQCSLISCKEGEGFVCGRIKFVNLLAKTAVLAGMTNESQRVVRAGRGAIADWPTKGKLGRREWSGKSCDGERPARGGAKAIAGDGERPWMLPVVAACLSSTARAAPGVPMEYGAQRGRPGVSRRGI
ncbi:hypothetical protein EV426DRAFT_574994 [Tirmania nivea]|nr:hypothetical protein EV426DRAFT_574994 [Tirmania nivea]